MSEVLTRSPTFSGKEEYWPFFKPKMSAHLAGRDCPVGVLLRAIVKDDDWEPIGETLTAEQKQAVAMRKLNTKAAGVLLNAMKTDTIEGKVAFDLVKQYITKENSGGHFAKAWKALEDSYEDEEDNSDTLADLMKEYYAMEMEQTERP